MDEPLSNLDAKLRVSMRAQLSRLHERLGVDDDLRHARPGRGDDARRPRRRAARRPAPAVRHARDLFRKPVNLFVAAFIGSPAMNLVDATVEDGEARFADWRLPLPERSPLRKAQRFVLGIRPHDFEVGDPSERSAPAAGAGEGRRRRAPRHRNAPRVLGRRAARERRRAARRGRRRRGRRRPARRRRPRDVHRRRRRPPPRDGRRDGRARRRAGALLRLRSGERTGARRRGIRHP